MKKATALSALVLLTLTANACGGYAHAPEIGPRPTVPEDKRKAFADQLMPNGDKKKVPANK